MSQIKLHVALLTRYVAVKTICRNRLPLYVATLTQNVAKKIDSRNMSLPLTQNIAKIMIHSISYQHISATKRTFKIKKANYAILVKYIHDDKI